MILVNMLILFTQCKQLLEEIHSLRLQLAGIHQLLVVLPPGAQVAFLRDELGGFAVVGFQEVDGFLPFGEPEFVLGHVNFLSFNQSMARGPVMKQNSLLPSHPAFCQTGATKP